MKYKYYHLVNDKLYERLPGEGTKYDYVLELVEPWPSWFVREHYRNGETIAYRG